MPTDIEIARNCRLIPIAEVAGKLGINEDALEPYGRYKAKIDPEHLSLPQKTAQPKLLLVTAISPTPAGEGKTTITVGLADALNRLGKKAVVALREPSLGPVFGVKGGATGGGYAQVAPMEDINLHFTGDFHAVGAANNLLAAMLDNHIYQGNALRIDSNAISLKRCMDVNDRQLRHIVCGLGGTKNGRPREDGYDITVATEVMAVFCLASDLRDLKARLSRMVVAYDEDGQAVTAGALGAAGAMTALLKDALKPNLVQTLEQTPAIIHGGPFANIAHGCNSVRSTRLAMALGDYTVTEAGFGADLGAEKFIDIKCRMSGLKPDAAVLVATVRALKYHGGQELKALKNEDLSALERGLPNLLRHVENMRTVFGLPLVVAINRFLSDTPAELEYLLSACRAHGINAALSEVWEKGGAGGETLAEEVIRLCETGERTAADGLAEGTADGGCSMALQTAYPLDWPLEEKLRTVARKVYRADDVVLLPAARKAAERFESMGYGGLPVCIAKTQSSFSDNPKLLGAPSGFKLTVRELRLAAGAGFIVALAGDAMTMPGLPKSPAAERIDIDDEGRIIGLF